MTFLRDHIKSNAARVAMVMPQARFDRGVLVLSHMRSATTALTNVLCSHPSISGYGETHVAYNNAKAPGRVLVNLALRRAFNPRAPFYTDKLLHNRLDDTVPASFFGARGLFLARLPEPAIRSITKLAVHTGMKDLETACGAALYYAERLEQLAILWDRFPLENRCGFEVEKLLSDPDRAVGDIGSWLNLKPMLKNRYLAHAATQKGGGGDPTRSANHTRIERSPAVADAMPLNIDLPDDLAARCTVAHKAMVDRFNA